MSSNASVYHCLNDLAVLERQDLVAQEYASSMALLSGLRKVCLLLVYSSLLCSARIISIRLITMILMFTCFMSLHKLDRVFKHYTGRERTGSRRRALALKTFSETLLATLRDQWFQRNLSTTYVLTSPYCKISTSCINSQHTHNAILWES